jgi:hypothetical protein
MLISLLALNLNHNLNPSPGGTACCRPKLFLLSMFGVRCFLVWSPCTLIARFAPQFFAGKQFYPAYTRFMKRERLRKTSSRICWAFTTRPVKKALLILLLLGALPIVAIAEREILQGLPYDDPNARKDAYGRVELKPLVSEYEALITQIETSKDAGVFGPKLQQRGFNPVWEPTNCAAPLFAPSSLTFSGLLEGEDKFHRDLYAVGNIGCLEFFYERDGKFRTAVWYARLDDKFVPLKSGQDIFNRLAWDKAKFEELKHWLQMHAAK